jgi:hypothetical protein
METLGILGLNIIQIELRCRSVRTRSFLARSRPRVYLTPIVPYGRVPTWKARKGQRRLPAFSVPWTVERKLQRALVGMGIRAPGGRAGPDSISLDEDIRTRVISMAEGQIRQAQECAASNVEVEILVGDAPAVVRDFVQEWNAHLLVISRSSASRHARS